MAVTTKKQAKIITSSNILKATEERISFDEKMPLILYPCAQLNANGAMFKYDLITTIAGKLSQFLNTISKFDTNSVETITAFHTTMCTVIVGEIRGNGGEKTQR